MAKHYLIAVEEKDEKLFRLFCEKNSKYAMVIGKETTNDRLRLDHLVYILNSISNQVGKSIGIKEWDNLRIYLKKKESNIVQTQKNIENISIKVINSLMMIWLFQRIREFIEDDLTI